MSSFLYKGATMAYEEKRAWIMVLTSTGGYAVYLAIILSRAGDVPLTHVSYAATLLWSVTIAIIVNMILNMAVAMGSPKGGDKKDERDREINRFGEYIGRSLVIAGATAALLMAMAQWSYFWIANVIYLAFVLSAILASVAKIVAYRRGFKW
jgi:hypothetical protein